MKIKNKSMIVTSLLILLGTSNTIHAKENVSANNVQCNQGIQVNSSEEQVEFKIKTSGSNVNLRSGPGTNYPIIAKIPNNSTITKISDFSNGEWAKTVFVGEGGKEYIGYIKYDPKYTEKVPQVNKTLAEITGNRVIFRSKDSKSSNKLGYFYKGNVVEIIEKAKNNYYKIKVVNTNGDYKNNIGYVHGDYVNILK